MTVFVWTMLAWWALKLGHAVFAPHPDAEMGEMAVKRAISLAVVVWCLVLLTGCGDGGETANVCTKDCGPKEPPQVDLRKP